MAMTRKSKDGGRDGERPNDFEEEPYVVGYGNPPKETRFKLNQSGNPKGRPRRPPTLQSTVAKVMKEQIKIREGERELRMSNLEALVRSAFRRALNGDPKILKMVTLMLRIERGEAQGEEIVDEKISAADEAILADFLLRHGVESDRSESQINETDATPKPAVAPKPPGDKS
jgi:hypothetical protein